MEIQVLIIETDSELRFLLKRILEEETTQFQVATAPDSFRALGRLLQQSYDLVLLDQNVAGEDWSELAQTIRAIWPDSHILLLVGAETFSGEIKKSGIFDSFIQKPFTPDQLLNVVGRLTALQN